MGLAVAGGVVRRRGQTRLGGPRLIVPTPVIAEVAAMVAGLYASAMMPPGPPSP